MAFIPSADDLEILLTEDLTWRIKEISALKSMIEKSAAGVARSSALRAALPMLYAHWEGYIKRSADRYLAFVYDRRPLAISLKPALAYAYLEPRFRGAGGGSSSFTPQAAIEFAERVKTVRTRANPNVMVNTKSNLRYEVLQEIVEGLAVPDFLEMTTKTKLNDHLCDKRNHIAHGESVPITEDAFEELRLEFTELMRSFKDRLITAATNREFLAV
ncbi:MAE_28990/MAE_18760 family HEPN-like nuclease [Brevundimonas sp.]|uniref:MAE_28990/MAE_18760 family HEPN-like nuclease n=1 Tax=Brevundimonas sp. TaxID=1871086 RepID=UPI003F7269AB